VYYVQIKNVFFISVGNGISYSSPVQNYQESNDCDDSSSNSDTGSTGTYIIERNDTSNDNKSEQSPDCDDNVDDFKKSNSMVKVTYLFFI